MNLKIRISFLQRFNLSTHNVMKICQMMKQKRGKIVICKILGWRPKRDERNERGEEKECQEEGVHHGRAT